METVLIPEYGVIHIKNALNEAEQKRLWSITKPLITNPEKSATGFSNFTVSHKKGKEKRNPEFDNFGENLFTLAAEELVKKIPNEEDAKKEPSFSHLQKIATGAAKIQLDQVRGNYYRPDAQLQNHCDSDEILFTMSVSLGDDCEFTVGKKTPRSIRLSERNGKEITIILKSGDAVFFDGGLVPHQVKRVVKGTGPAWWEEEKVNHGSRCVVLWREKERDFYKERLINKKI